MGMYRWPSEPVGGLGVSPYIAVRRWAPPVGAVRVDNHERVTGREGAVLPSAGTVRYLTSHPQPKGETQMLYLGIDQHARQHTVSLRDDHGDIVQAQGLRGMRVRYG